MRYSSPRRPSLAELFYFCVKVSFKAEPHGGRAKRGVTGLKITTEGRDVHPDVLIWAAAALPEWIALLFSTPNPTPIFIMLVKQKLHLIILETLVCIQLRGGHLVITISNHLEKFAYFPVSWFQLYSFSFHLVDHSLLFSSKFTFCSVF